MGYVTVRFKNQDVPMSVIESVESTDLLEGFLVVHHKGGSHQFTLDSVLIWSYYVE